MTTSVWAPRAQRVDLRAPARGADIPMQRGDGGWWHAAVTLAGGEEYGFVLDGADSARPDPRSRRRPRGVHDLSVGFDPADHEWQDTAWTGRQLAGGVVYELHVGTFTPEGTLDAAPSASTTSSISASTSSSSCRSMPSTACTTGGMTESSGSPCTSRTADPPPTSASSTPVTAPAWA
nr:hypothetical protein GCM10025699_29830 [Microbacterium flavescens]